MVFAQTIYCPSNLDFEQGNLNNWKFDTGSCCPIVTTPVTGPIANRHVLTTGTNTDTYGGFPIVAPGGGSYSLKLGNYLVGRQAERARYYVQVPPGTGKHMLIYRYAVVFQDPGHSPADQPRFEVKAFDSATNAPIACNQHVYVSSSALPGFFLSPVSGATDVYYKPWTTASINLTGYNGKTVIIDFASGDCDQSGHFGYGYVDMNCGLFQIYGAKCDSSANITLKGPPGFAQYQWRDSALTTIIGTTQSITIPTPATPKKFAVIVTPYQGFGCIDTIYTAYSIVNDNMQASITPDTAKCENTGIQLNVSTSNANGPFSYTWTPATALNCSFCPNPISYTTSAITYTNYIENQYGCRDTNKVSITIKPTPQVNAGPDANYCDTNIVTLSGSGSNGTNYSWYPASIVVNPNLPVTTATVAAGSTNLSLVLLNTASGCSDTDQVTIKTGTAVANAGTDATLCEGTQGKLFGAGGYSYSWTPVSGLSSPSAQSPTFTAAATTTYTLVVTTNIGCKDTDDVLITVVPSAFAGAGADTAICDGGIIQLSGSGGDTYQWIPATGLSNPFVQNPVASPAVTTTYKLAVAVQGKCNDTDEITVVVHPLPVAEVSGDTLICKGADLELLAGGGSKYHWFPADWLSDPAIQYPVAKIVDSITYYVAVLNEFGCSDTASTIITISPPPVFSAGIDTSICSGDTISVFAAGGDVYWWHEDDAISGKTDSMVSVWPSIPHDYTVTITDTICNLEEERQVKVDVFPLRQLKIVATPIQCGAEIGQLTAYGGKSYTWTPAEHLTFPNAAVTKASPKVTTRYTLTGVNGYGCRDTAEATLEVHGDDGIFAPGAFSPNGDGLNDCYRLIVTGNIISFEFHIYNRWGQEVFTANNYNTCWDGKINGEPQDLGTYYYFYKARSPLCGDIMRKGDLTLVK
jgi:gliding motility-associated-like protein